MKYINRKTIALGAASLAVMVGAGSALALGTPEDSEAMLGDVATSLGVEQEALEDAIRDAQINRVDAAEAEGQLSEERAAEMRERIESAETPLLGGPRDHHGHHGKGLGGPRAALEPAAEALGVTTDELRDLLPGTSLAAIAADKGVAVEDVESAIVAASQEKLDQAVADGRIDASRAADAADRIAERAGDMVDRTFPEEGELGARGFGKHRGDPGDGLLPPPAPAGDATPSEEAPTL